MAIEHGLMTTQWSNELESAAHVHKVLFYKQQFFLPNESFNAFNASGPSFEVKLTKTQSHRKDHGGNRSSIDLYLRFEIPSLKNQVRQT